MANGVQLNGRAIASLLKSEEVRRDLEKRVKRGASAAGDGYASESSIGRTRALAMVWADSPSAKAREGRQHNLMRAQDAMRR